MTYLLMWIELLLVALSFAALMLALAWRAPLARMRWLRIALGVGLPLLLAVGLCVGTAYLKWQVGLRRSWFLPSVAWLICLVAGQAWLLLRSRTPEDQLTPIHSTAVGALGLMLLSITFWNADLAVQLRMATWRVEAGAIALSIAPPRIPDSQNAAFVYYQAFELLEDGKPLSTHGDWLSKDTVLDLQHKDVVYYLERNKQSLPLLRQAAGMSDCYWERTYAQPSLSMMLPELTKLRNAARLLAISARSRAQQKDWKGALNEVGLIFNLARHTANEPIMVSALVSVAIERIGQKTLEGVIADLDTKLPDWRIPVLEQPGFSLRRQLSRCFRMEEAFGLSAFSSLGDTDAMLDIGVGEMSRSKFSGLALAVWRVFLLSDDVHSYRRWMRDYHQLLNKPYHQTQDLRDKLARRAKQPRGGLLTSMLLPALKSVSGTIIEGDARIRLCQLALAVQRYRKQHGRFPPQLSALVPGTIASIPIDPFDGKPLRMASTQKAVLLYSIGADLRDGGGGNPKHTSNSGDVVFRISR